MILERIADYEILERCGRGAAGEVYLARTLAGSLVALKVVERNSAVERELAGLRNYSRLAPHPNLVRIFHVGESGDSLYYTMELADDCGAGRYRPETLASRLAARKRLGVEEMTTLMRKLLAGLAALHRAGLAHRDIKPENILFVGGEPKLSDIGLVRSVSQSLSLGGTLGFIPPERLKTGTGSQHAADDLYALGKVLYCCLTGLEPSDYPSLPPELLRDEYRKLNTVVITACNHNPALRFRSAAAFASALKDGVPARHRIKTIAWGMRYYLLAVVTSTIMLTTLFLLIRPPVLTKQVTEFANEFANEHDSIPQKISLAQEDKALEEKRQSQNVIEVPSSAKTDQNPTGELKLSGDTDLPAAVVSKVQEAAVPKASAPRENITSRIGTKSPDSIPTPLSSGKDQKPTGELKLSGDTDLSAAVVPNMQEAAVPKASQQRENIVYRSATRSLDSIRVPLGPRRDQNPTGAADISSSSHNDPAAKRKAMRDVTRAIFYDTPLAVAARASSREKMITRGTPLRDYPPEAAEEVARLKAKLMPRELPPFTLGEIANRESFVIAASDGSAAGKISSSGWMDPVYILHSPLKLDYAPRRRELLFASRGFAEERWKHILSNNFINSYGQLKIAGKGRLQLDMRLPDDYAIAFEVDAAGLDGALFFGAVALDKRGNDLTYYSWGIRSEASPEATLTKLEYQPQDERKIDFELKKDVLLKNGFHRVEMVQTTYFFRLFIDDRLVIHSPSLFFGGFFFIESRVKGGCVVLKNFRLEAIPEVNSCPPDQQYKLPVAAAVQPDA